MGLQLSSIFYCTLMYLVYGCSLCATRVMKYFFFKLKFISVQIDADDDVIWTIQEPLFLDYHQQKVFLLFKIIGHVNMC